MVLSALLRAVKVGNGSDLTSAPDYFADVDDPGVLPTVDVDEPIR